MARNLITYEECVSLSAADVRRLYRGHVNPALATSLGSFAMGEVEVDHADGVWIHARDGRRYLDASGGMGVLGLGHNHPRVLAARARYQRERRMEVHKQFFSPWLAALSHNVAALLPEDLDYPFFCNSGAEANEGALKLAFKAHAGKRSTVLHADIGFHGKLLGAGSVSGPRAVWFPYPRLPGVDSFTYGDIDSVTEALGRHRSGGRSDVYALIIEPFSCSTFRHCDETFLGELRALCSDEDIVLIFDEVYSGWFRAADWFYSLRVGVTPDILTTSKSFGGGKASISAFVARGPLLERAYGQMRDVTLHTTTYNGFGEECVTALEAINVMAEDDYPALARRLESSIGTRCEALLSAHGDVIERLGGLGLHQGIFFKPRGRAIDAVLKHLPLSSAKDTGFFDKLTVAALTDWLFAEHGVYLIFSTYSEIGLAISPAVIMTEAELDRVFEALDAALDVGLNKIILRFATRMVSRRVAT